MCENCDRKYNTTVCDLHVVRHCKVKSAMIDPTLEHHSVLLPPMLPQSTRCKSQTNVYFLLMKLELFQTPFEIINHCQLIDLCFLTTYICRDPRFAKQCATELMDSAQNVLYLFTMIREYKPFYSTAWSIPIPGIHFDKFSVPA